MVIVNPISRCVKDNFDKNAGEMRQRTQACPIESAGHLCRNVPKYDTKEKSGQRGCPCRVSLYIIKH